MNLAYLSSKSYEFFPQWASLFLQTEETTQEWNFPIGNQNELKSSTGNRTRTSAVIAAITPTTSLPTLASGYLSLTLISMNLATDLKKYISLKSPNKKCHCYRLSGKIFPFQVDNFVNFWQKTMRSRIPRRSITKVATIGLDSGATTTLLITLAMVDLMVEVVPADDEDEDGKFCQKQRNHWRKWTKLRKSFPWPSVASVDEDGGQSEAWRNARKLLTNSNSVSPFNWSGTTLAVWEAVLPRKKIRQLWKRFARVRQTEGGRQLQRLKWRGEKDRQVRRSFSSSFFFYYFSGPEIFTTRNFTCSDWAGGVYWVWQHAVPSTCTSEL